MQYLKHGWCYVWSIRYINIIIVVKFKVGDHEEWQIIDRHVHQIELSDLWHFPKDTLKIAFEVAEKSWWMIHPLAGSALCLKYVRIGSYIILSECLK